LRDRREFIFHSTINIPQPHPTTGEYCSPPFGGDVTVRRVGRDLSAHISQHGQGLGYAGELDFGEHGEWGKCKHGLEIKQLVKSPHYFKRILHAPQASLALFPSNAVKSCAVPIIFRRTNMSETRKLRIFLSYTHADIAPVRKLYQDLNDKGFDVWLDDENLIGGQEWKSEIEKALENSDIVIVCLSNNSVSKEGFVQREFKFALDKTLEMTEDGIFLIPVRLEECKVPSKLSRYHWVDLFAENGLNRLMKALSLRMSQVAEREKVFRRGNLDVNTFTSGQDVNETNHTGSPKEITPEMKNEKIVKSSQKNKKNDDRRNIADEKITSTQSLIRLKESDWITMSKWGSTLRPLWLAIPTEIYFGGLQTTIPDMASGSVWISITTIFSIVSISLIQWNLLRRYFSKASLWLSLNIVYMFLSVLVDYLLVSIMLPNGFFFSQGPYSQEFYMFYSVFMYIIFSAWLVFNYNAGLLIAKQDVRIVSFLSGIMKK
jgi:hypothetical protein